MNLYLPARRRAHSARIKRRSIEALEIIKKGEITHTVLAERLEVNPLYLYTFLAPIRSEIDVVEGGKDAPNSYCLWTPRAEFDLSFLDGLAWHRN